jgi:hypothetical protein
MSGWHWRFYDNAYIHLRNLHKGDSFDIAPQKTIQRLAALHFCHFWQPGFCRNSQAELA